MSTLDESISSASPLNADLKVGVESISRNEVVTFTKYVRLVLPLDGFIFWVRADKLSASALLNASALNAFALNQPLVITTPAPFLQARGSLHYATETRQDESEIFTVNRVVFTAEDEVQDLNQVGPNVIFIATIDDIKFAFSSRGMFYQAAKLFHYGGAAVYSDMESQLIDAVHGFDSKNVVVSNSLPFWLSLTGLKPGWPFHFTMPSVTFYPSFLVPKNLSPPFASVHVPPDGTRAIAAAPSFGPTMTHTQLAVDHVRVTLYGLRNDHALDYVDFVTQYALDSGLVGIMNQPIIRDEKRTQVELMALAMKKTVDFDVNYYQTRINSLARQLILSAIPTFEFSHG